TRRGPVTVRRRAPHQAEPCGSASGWHSPVQEAACSRSLAMRLAMRAFRRAALFLCSVEPLAALSMRLWLTRWYLAAASKSPASAAFTAFLVKVRMALLRERLISRALADLMMRLFADLVLAIVLLKTSPAKLCSLRITASRSSGSTGP